MMGRDIAFLVAEMAGGLALFIFGMNIMADGLRQAAGSHLRKVVARATANRVAGIGLGTLLGALVHSSAATVMFVGFVDAGLMSLAQAIPPILGANLGTALSLQLISFRLHDYCYFAIAAGFILRMAGPRPSLKHAGVAMVGFGMLFLGMRTMSEAMIPHRAQFASFLSAIDGTTWPGMWRGILISTLVTGIIQSSGATIGMCYALISAGVITSLPQVYPIVLGAHIGTCVTALLGSMGTNIEARRTAVAHLLFNVLNVLMAVAAARVFLWLIPLTADNLVHQTANLHTVVMLASALLVLPVSTWFARLVRLIIFSRAPLPEPSHLDDRLLAQPAQAVRAVLAELGRTARVCLESVQTVGATLPRPRRAQVRRVRLNEKSVNEIKLAVIDYLTTLTSRRVPPETAVLIQRLNRCMAEVERIGDHIDSAAGLVLACGRVEQTRFAGKILEWADTLNQLATDVVRSVADSFDPANAEFQAAGAEILRAEAAYESGTAPIHKAFVEECSAGRVPASVGFFFSEYIAACDRIVRHARDIAVIEQQPGFCVADASAPYHYPISSKEYPLR